MSKVQCYKGSCIAASSSSYSWLTKLFWKHPLHYIWKARETCASKLMCHVWDSCYVCTLNATLCNTWCLTGLCNWDFNWAPTGDAGGRDSHSWCLSGLCNSAHTRDAGGRNTHTWCLRGLCNWAHTGDGGECATHTWFWMVCVTGHTLWMLVGATLTPDARMVCVTGHILGMLVGATLTPDVWMACVTVAPTGDVLGMLLDATLTCGCVVWATRTMVEGTCIEAGWKLEAPATVWVAACDTSKVEVGSSRLESASFTCQSI